MDTDQIDFCSDLSDDSILRLVEELQDTQASQTAAAELWQRLHKYLERRTAALIADRYRAQVSEESAVNQAFKSFLSGAARGEFELQDRGALLGLLAKMAANKLRTRLRELNAQKRSAPPVDSAESDTPQPQPGHPKKTEKLKRNYRSNHPIDPDASQDSGCQGPTLDRFLAEADTAMIITIKEKLEPLGEDLQEFFLLRYIDGFTDDEIAERLGNMSLQAVRWKHETIKEVFDDLRDDFDSEETESPEQVPRKP